MKISSLLFCFFLFAAACTDNVRNNTIRVVGEGKVRVEPDQVILTISAEFIRSRMVESVKYTQETIDSVLNILQAYSTNKNDIKTSSITANKHYEYNGRRNVFSGFVAQQSVDFVLNDISKFTELTGRLLETRINSISGIRFSHSKADSLFREADLLAYDDALKSGQQLCGRAGRSLGKLVMMTNQNLPAEYSTEMANINTYSKGYGGRGFTISPEVLEFRRSVTSEFLIE